MKTIFPVVFCLVGTALFGAAQGITAGTCVVGGATEVLSINTNGAPANCADLVR